MNGTCETPFPKPGSYTGADYLTFLSQRVPRDLGLQLIRDAGCELGLSKDVEVTDLVSSLSSHSFPADCRSIGVFHVSCILEYIIYGYCLDLAKGLDRDDPYKQIYVASLYLHCCLQGSGANDAYLCALQILATVGGQLDFEGRLQVSRFLASLIPMVQREREIISMTKPTPLSCALVAMSVIVAHILDDLGLLAERAMQEERFGPAWRKAQEEGAEGDLDLGAMEVLKRSAADLFGKEGKMRQIAGHFLQAIEEGSVEKDYGPNEDQTGQVRK